MYTEFKNQVVRSASEAISLGKLDWTVSKQPIYCNNGKVLNGYNAIVRSDNDMPLGVVKSRYTLLQNKDAFKIMDNLMSEGMQYHSVASYKGGRIVAIEARLPRFTTEVVKGDIVEVRLSFSTSHDGSKSLRMIYAPYRLVCTNGMVTADRDLTGLITAKHTESMVNKIMSVKNLFLRIQNETEKLVSRMKIMANKQITDSMKDKYLLSLFGYETTLEKDIPTRSKNIMAEIFNLSIVGKGTEIPGVKGSVWGMYNAVTEYTDHYASVKGDNEDDSRRFSALYGSNAELKTVAFEKALQLV